MDELPDNVVQLDVLRINRTVNKRCTCYNRGFVVDAQNKEVTCNKCGARVDPFDAMLDLARSHETLNEQHRALLQQRKELQSYKPWLVVIRELERNYRGRKMLPTCPNCSQPFYLEEIRGWTSEELVRKRRERVKE